MHTVNYSDSYIVVYLCTTTTATTTTMQLLFKQPGFLQYCYSRWSATFGCYWNWTLYSLDAILVESTVLKH